LAEKQFLCAQRAEERSWSPVRKVTSRPHYEGSHFGKKSRVGARKGRNGSERKRLASQRSPLPVSGKTCTFRVKESLVEKGEKAIGRRAGTGALEEEIAHFYDRKGKTAICAC